MVAHPVDIGHAGQFEEYTTALLLAILQGRHHSLNDLDDPQAQGALKARDI